MSFVSDSLAFPLAEYGRRLRRVQAAMAGRGIDALLLQNRADVYYLTGMQTCYMVAYHAAIVPADGDPVLVTSDFEMFNAHLGAWCGERIAFPVGADPIQATCAVLRERSLGKGRIGVERHTLSASDFQAVREHLPDAELVEAGDILPQIKVIKSTAEIAYLREAGRISTLGMEAAFAEAALGKTENDLAAAADNAMVRAGSEFMCIDPIVTAGKRSGVPHSTYRRSILRPGDAVLIEVGACVSRYSAPLMRTVALAPVPAEVRRAADACRDCVNVLIEHMRPGARAREVAARAKVVLMPLVGELIWHGIYAYSVGVGFPPDWNDAPMCITEDSDVILQPGMCFHTSTSLRRAVQFGTAMSETVLITDTGNEVLTGGERELRVI